MGDDETWISVYEESLLGYHSYSTGILTDIRDPDTGPWQMGSLTGAVASERVTEAPKGSLSADGNRAKSAKAGPSETASDYQLTLFPLF